jgi:undecaprenyl-diphosphatase
VHGPAELLPISSSGHVALVRWLLGWNGQLDDEHRKALDVALHAGAAAALLIVLRDQIGEAVREVDAQRIVLLALSLLPPAAVGLVLERPIEQHLGTPGTVAAGLACGALVMAVADRAPQTRQRDQLRALDALWLGIAQASALFPGVSRNGATVAAARLRGFTRSEASWLSAHIAPPVIVAATGLKGLRLARRGVGPDAWLVLAAGACAAFAATVGSRRLMAREGSLLPFAIYRLGVATTVLACFPRRSARWRKILART